MASQDAAGGAFLSPGDPLVSADDDGDQTAEPAETVELTVPVQNLGGSGAAGGEMRLQVAGGPASVLAGHRDHSGARRRPFGAGRAVPPGDRTPARNDGAVVALDVTLTVPAGTFAARRALAVAGPVLAFRRPHDRRQRRQSRRGRPCATRSGSPTTAPAPRAR